MDISNIFTNVNWLGVFLATLSAFALGALWYSPVLFGNLWMKENGFTMEGLKADPGNMALMYGTTFVLAFIMAFCIMRFFHPVTAIGGIKVGALIGVAFVSTAIGTHYIFEKRSIRHLFINAGYTTVCLMIMGAIIGALS